MSIDKTPVGNSGLAKVAVSSSESTFVVGNAKTDTT